MNEIKNPDKITSYFKAEWKTLLIITLTGLIYNIGLLAGPLFEGRLAQCLLDIFQEKAVFRDMAFLAVLYVAVIALVQGARYLKRLYVRRFANNINRSMKQIIYGSLIHRSKKELEEEGVGRSMTKAISDVEACVEGMRKFTTEVFDTGIALLGYVGLLVWYDWRLACLSLIFPPFSYLIAEKLKVAVQRTGAKWKESTDALNAETMDRVEHALPYRVYGVEKQREKEYEKYLKDYERKGIKANLLVSVLPPLYHVISMISVVFIVYFGGKNVLGRGWELWDIAAFTTFLSCYSKLSVKSSKAAKLFNSVQKAQVSWKRIHPLLKNVPEEISAPKIKINSLEIRNLGVKSMDGRVIFEGLSMDAEPGEIIGVTGPVACGKSMLGKVFLCEEPYLGSVKINGKELSELEEKTRQSVTGYLGHDPELMSDTIKNNLLLGMDKEISDCLKMVCIDKETEDFPDGVETIVGRGGILLSGGQKQRLALGRTLLHERPLLVLDDPFSALDRKTEQEIFQNIKGELEGKLVFFISHRLYLFPYFDKVLWMENGKTVLSSHQELMEKNPSYERLYRMQTEGGGSDEEKK